MQVAIVTDSTAWFTSKEVDKIKNLYVLPLSLVTTNKSYLDDPVVISRAEVYQLIKKYHVTTCQVSYGQAEQLFIQLLKKYDKVLFLGLSTKISGEYKTIYQLCQQDPFLNKVTVYETSAIAGVLKEMVLTAHAMLSNGNSIGKTLEALDELKPTEIFFLINDPTYLERSGRVSKWVVSFCKVFKIIPILQFKDGEIKAKSKKRTIKNAIRYILDDIVAQGNTNNLFVYNTNLSLKSTAIIYEIIKEYPFKRVVERDISNIIIAHIGDGCFGLMGLKHSYQVNNNPVKEVKKHNEN